jgi:hypothetical protein
MEEHFDREEESLKAKKGRKEKKIERERRLNRGTQEEGDGKQGSSCLHLSPRPSISFPLDSLFFSTHHFCVGNSSPSSRKRRGLPNYFCRRS